MLEKIQIVDQIYVAENGSVQVRTKTAIMEDGKQISSTLHRHTIAPGADYSAEDTHVQDICAATHTADVIAAYKESLKVQGV
jgi:hypothetical protein